jgi:hypothetical protein
LQAAEVLVISVAVVVVPEAIFTAQMFPMLQGLPQQ